MIKKPNKRIFVDKVTTSSLVDNGRQWRLFGKNGEWRIQVWDNEYKFMYSNLRFNANRKPWEQQSCCFVGESVKHIDKLVWGEGAYSSEYLRYGSDKLHELTRTFNEALPRGMSMPPELWSNVRTWIRRNYDWKP